MRVLSIRGRVTTACTASEGYDAEMEILTDEGQILFLHLNAFDGEHYTAAPASIFDFMTGRTAKNPRVCFTEEYNSWAKAQKSAYKPYFAVLRKILNILG